MRPAVFLDRDGTLNPDSGFISKPEDFNLYPYTAEAIKMLNLNGFLTFLVTNQSGIARGFLTYEQLTLIHHKLEQQLAEKEAYLDGIFVAPYFENGIVEPYNIKHFDRKPGLGLFNKAQENFDFYRKGSFMIGDRYSDIAFGKNAGLITILVLTGEGKREFWENRLKWEKKPNYVVKDLLTAVKLILSPLV